MLSIVVLIWELLNPRPVSFSIRPFGRVLRIAGLFGASEPYHLLALKEDLDSRPPPDMSEGFTVPELLNPGRNSGVSQYYQCRP